MTRSRLRRDEAVGFVWLLSIEWAGRTYRWSTYPVAPLDTDGTPVLHDGGLDLSEWDGDLEWLSTTPGQKSVPIEVDWPEDIPARIALGHSLDTATGELSLLADGGAYADRVVLLRGVLDQPEYGAMGEPLRASLVSETDLTGTAIPEARYRVTEETWPSASYTPDDYDVYYPRVWGSPGVYADGTMGRGSRAVVIHRENLSNEAQTLLISDRETTAATVYIIDEDGLEESFNVTHSVDGKNQPVDLVDISGAGTIDLTDTDFGVSWAGGAASTAATAGRYMLELLRLCTSVDEVRARPAADYLDRYAVDAYIDDSADVVDLLDQLLRVLPVSVAQGPDGVYPVVWRLDARREDAVATLTAGAGLVRTGPWRYERSLSDVISEVRLTHSVDIDGDGVEHVLSAVDNGGSASCVQAEVAYRRYGVRSAEVTCGWTWTSAPSVAVAYLIAHLPSRVAEYEGDLDLIGWLAPGDVVVLVDSEMSFDGIAFVTALRYADGQARVTLKILDDYGRLP